MQLLHAVTSFKRKKKKKCFRLISSLGSNSCSLVYINSVKIFPAYYAKLVKLIYSVYIVTYGEI